MPKLLIEKNKFRENYKYYTSRKEKVIFVVKSNAYGVGLNKIVKFILNEGGNFFAVFTIKEAIKIRKINKYCFILLLNSIEKKDINICKKLNINICINSLNDYYFYKKNKLNLPVQIKIDTGMHRFGLNKFEFLQVINDKDLNITGIFSHLVGGESNIDYIKKQVTIFDDIISNINREKLLIHICSSSSFEIIRSKYQNAVRIGLGIYGFSNYFNPCVSLYLPIVCKKEIKKGEYCSYDCSFKAQENGYIYIIPIGYHNWLSQKAIINVQGFINAGKICMNSLILYSKNNYIKKAITLSSYDLIKICNDNNMSIYSLLSSFAS